MLVNNSKNNKQSVVTIKVWFYVFCFKEYRRFSPASGYDPLPLSFTLGSASPTFVVTKGNGFNWVQLEIVQPIRMHVTKTYDLLEKCKHKMDIYGGLQ